MTAEKFLKEYFKGLQPLTRDESYIKDESIDLVIKLLQKFARLKVKEALEAAAEKALVKTIIPIDNGCMMYTDAYVDVDRESILNSYDINSIV
jgi:hypothetical protein